MHTSCQYAGHIFALQTCGKLPPYAVTILLHLVPPMAAQPSAETRFSYYENEPKPDQKLCAAYGQRAVQRSSFLERQKPIFRAKWSKEHGMDLCIGSQGKRYHDQRPLMAPSRMMRKKFGYEQGKNQRLAQAVVILMIHKHSQMPTEDT